MPLVEGAPYEKRVAWCGFAVLLLILAAHAILETARDALFLASLPVDQLPWLYLIIAAAGLAVTRFEATIGKALHQRDWLAATLAGASVLTVGLWAGADFVSGASLWVLYVWTGLYGTVALLQLWLTLTAAFDVEQAKRLFAFVGAGALLGATLGAAGARVMTDVLPTRHLVAAAAGCMALAAIVARFWLRPAARAAAREIDGRPSPKAQATAGRDLGEVARHPYTRRVILFVLVLGATVIVGDFVFKRAVATHVERAELGAFFATFYVAVNVSALALQLIVVRWLLQHVGAHRSLMILPLLMLAGGVWLGLTGVLAAALFVKGADGALRHSAHKTALEVLFVPLSSQLRANTKTVADVVGHRGGQAAGSVIVLAVLLSPIADAALPWLLVGLAVCAAVVAWSTRRARERLADAADEDADTTAAPLLSQSAGRPTVTDPDI